MSGIILTSKRLRLKVGAFMLLMLSVLSSLAQSENVGIGTVKPDNSAILELSSTSKGFLIPRMTLAQRAGIKSPATGLLVYQIDFFTGFYFFDGEVWKSFYARGNDGASFNSNPVTPVPTNSSVGWSIGGNSGLNAEVNFLGTKDTTSLVFKVNNYRSGLIDFRSSNTYFGYRAGYRSQGYNSIAIGAYALNDANMGLNNIAIGYQSLLRSQTGSDNVAVGANSLNTNISGSQNVGIGTQAGLRSVGDGNIFIGYKAGMNEIGDNKLYIDNNFKKVALIYGDFEKSLVGINTQSPGSALSVDSKIVNMSGLEFKQLNSDSPAEKPSLKVLSVDKQGRVVLVRDSVGTSSSIPVSVPSYWSLKGSSIENSNAGDVILSNIRFKNLSTTSPTIKSNGKILTVDENGLIVLARDSIGTSATSYWGLNGSTLSNTNTGKVILNGLIQLGNIKASNTAFRPNGKVLSVDDSGNIILVRDSVATESTIPLSASPWISNGENIGNSNNGAVYINNSLILSKLNSEITVTKSAQKFLTVDNSGNVILANVTTPTSTTSTAASDWTLDGANIFNKNTGGVYINNSLILSKLSSDSTVIASAQKFLTVDKTGNVILANINVPSNTTTTPTSDWALDGGNISNKNTGGVYINNGLWAKNGFRLQSGTLELNSAVENNSGLQFAQLKASNPASRPSGKVLSVDDNGNVILVRDSVGVATSTTSVASSQWTTSGTTIVNSNTGRVIINNGLTLPFTSEAITPISTQKFLTVDNAGNVILGNVPNSTPSSWTISGNDIVNSNLGKAYISNGLSVKSGINIESGNLVTNGSLTNRSGLVLNQLKLSFPASRPSGKVLSVDDNGNVILVRDSVGVAGTILDIPASWTVSSDNISNANTGTVSIKSLTLPNLSSNNTPTVSTQKVLSVDANGNVILVNTPTTTVGTTQKVELWKTDTTGAILNNNTQGVVITANADGKSGLQFAKLKASSAAGNRYGKVLSVDDNGNVILVKDSVVTVNTIPVSPSPWNINGDNIANSNNGKVYINNSLILSKLSSDSTVIASAQKFLTVDKTGNVILANVPTRTDTTHTSDWALDGGNISNKNTGGVYINNGLWAKNGFRLQSGTLELNSAVENNSGLQFAQLKASNPASRPSGKVLSVDDNGNVILVRDSVGVATSTTSVASSQWTTSGTTIVNSNTGRVIINNGLTLPFTSEAITPISTQKFLTVDNAGNVILGNVPNSTPSSWTISGNDIVNSNLGKAYISNGLSVKSGINIESGNLVTNGSLTNRSGLVLNQLKLSFPASRPSGKVLSVDDNGNVILVRDSVGVAGTILDIPASWTVSSDNISNANTGTVSIKSLTLPNLSSNNTPTVSTQKVLSVDANGNVILVNTPNTTTTPTSDWALDGGNISNKNTGGVYINNGLWAKNGFRLQSGTLELNSAVENNSGLQFAQLKASNPASKPSGKVLSVDDNGNVILVRDSVSVAGTILDIPASWTVSADNISNANTGSVSINTLTLPKLSSNNTPTVTTQKVLSVDTNGNVILVNTPTTTVGTTPKVEIWKTDTSGVILNNNTQGVVITTNADGKSGLQFAKLKAASPAGDRYGKVLSVDDNGNVILVNDGVTTGGSNTGAGWAITDGRLQNSNNGKVVIGTGINSFPGDFQLYVKGGILTERVRVAVANSDLWADYVFENGYKLMPLRDVEKHIDYYHHLPNVPSAEQIVKSGMDIMETSAKLLEKIEELTLYMIKANKQIELLEAKVNNLEKVQK